MGLVALILLVVLASAVPDLCPTALGIDRHAPDLFLATVVYLVVRGRGFSALPYAILVGLARDCLSVDPLGTHAFVLGTVAFVLVRTRSGSVPPAGASRLARTFIASLGASALYYLRLLPVAEARAPASTLLDALPVALWTTLAAAPLFTLLDTLKVFDSTAGRSDVFSS